MDEMTGLIPMFHGEAMLRRVSANGEVVLLLDDVSAIRAMAAREGRVSQRFAMVLVRIGDDEHPETEVQVSHEIRWGTLEAGLKMLDRIEDKPPSNQAAIMCGDPGFQWFMFNRKFACHPGTMPTPKQDDVVRWLREELGIESRSELDTDPHKWDKLKEDARAWFAEKKGDCR